MRRAVAGATGAAMLLVLAGCAIGPDPHEVGDHASEVFDAMVAELGSAQATVLRTLEVVPPATEPCDEGDLVQQSFLARGTLSVEAPDGAAGSLLTRASDTLGGEWEPMASTSAGQRAWSSEDGITVTVTDATPVLVVAVFTPCVAPTDTTPGPDGA